jgi:hypothetical protein
VPWSITTAQSLDGWHGARSGHATAVRHDARSTRAGTHELGRSDRSNELVSFAGVDASMTYMEMSIRSYKQR